MRSEWVAFLGAVLITSAASGASADSGGHIYLSADAVYAWRQTPDGNGAVIVPVVGPTPVYTPSMLSIAPDTGMDLRAGWQGQAWAFETRYFGGFGWSGDTDRGAVGNVRIGSYQNFDVIDLHPALVSKLDTEETMVRFGSGPLSFGGGVRWLQFHDVFDAGVTFPAFSADYNRVVDSNGLGPQVEAMAHLALAPSGAAELAYLNLEGRAGVFFETTQDNFDLAPSTGGSYPASSTGAVTSAFAEGGATLGLALGPTADVHIGYRALYIDKVATAAGDQANNTALNTNGAAPVYGSLLVQAISAGATLKF